MTKKVIGIISTDWHISANNTEIIIGLINQKIELAKKLKTPLLFCLGDVFQSRQAQPLSTLKAFETILDNIKKEGMQLQCIPGNHDKTDYSSENSFLDPFTWHPGLVLHRTLCVENLKGFNFNLHYLPYFEEEKWLDLLSKPYKEEGAKNILFSHQAITGSVNNGGSKVENGISQNKFEFFDKIFLGHYHNQHKIGENIYHLPSIQANNFGEDNEKGFTILYEDGSHELSKSNFNEFHTIEINLDKVSKEDLSELKKQGASLIKETGANIRFNISGTEDKVKALKTDEFSSLGIKIKKDNSLIEKSIKRAETSEIVVYDEDKIIEKFEEYCKAEKYDNYQYGKECLQTKLDQNGKGK